MNEPMNGETKGGKKEINETICLSRIAEGV